MLRGRRSARISSSLRLVFVDGAAGVAAGFGLERRRDDLQRRRDLADHRLEAREEQRGDVELALLEQLR